MAAFRAGEFVPSASKSVDTICLRELLVYVCAGICLSNFPATAYLWVCLVNRFLVSFTFHGFSENFCLHRPVFHC